jgi:hypothetical protein
MGDKDPVMGVLRGGPPTFGRVLYSGRALASFVQRKGPFREEADVARRSKTKRKPVMSASTQKPASPARSEADSEDSLKRMFFPSPDRLRAIYGREYYSLLCSRALVSPEALRKLRYPELEQD